MNSVQVNFDFINKIVYDDTNKCVSIYVLKMYI